MTRRAFMMAGAVFFGSEARHVEQPAPHPRPHIVIPDFCDNGRLPSFIGSVRFGPSPTPKGGLDAVMMGGAW